MFLMSQISGISIAGFVILALFVLLGLKKGFLRMLLTVLAIGLSIAAGSLAVKPIYNALAKKDFFGQEWLEGALSASKSRAEALASTALATVCSSSSQLPHSRVASTRAEAVM